MRVNPQPKPLSSNAHSRLERVNVGRNVGYGDVPTVTLADLEARNHAKHVSNLELAAEMKRRNAWADERSGTPDCEGQEMFWSQDADD